MTQDTSFTEHIERPSHPLILDPSVTGVNPEALRLMGSALAINEALPGLNKHEPTAMLLDINNLYRRADDNGWRIDYNKLKTIFESRCDLRYCGAFSAVDRSNTKSNAWALYMADKGYVTVTKDLKRYVSRNGENVSKGNMDVEITVAAMDLSEAFAHVIIGSCDGDFLPLVERLRKGHFRRVSVLGITNDGKTGMSETLARAGDNFYDLTEIKEHVSYKGRNNE
jgi:uncharacterized LabA/DUF88 family protein